MPVKEYIMFSSQIMLHMFTSIIFKMVTLVIRVMFLIVSTNNF